MKIKLTKIDDAFEDIEASYSENYGRHGSFYSNDKLYALTPGDPGTHKNKKRKFYFKNKEYGESILYRRNLY